MKIYKVSNSLTASKLIPIIRPSEGATTKAEGIFIGFTKYYSIPLFLDLNALINPHISVIGMSGSGKTYFLKSIILRSNIYMNYGVFILDWNGEYSELVGYAGGKELFLDTSLDPTKSILEALKYIEFNKITYNNQIISCNLSNIKNREYKAQVSKILLKMISDEMITHRINRKVSNIIVIDEAWKLLDSNELSMLFREGRKYGFSIVIATQLAKDILNDIISNSASISIFKLQNSEDFSLLMESGVISESNKDLISNLERGSCLLMQRLRVNSGMQTSTIIKQVSGFDYSTCNIVGGKMDFKIANNIFLKETEAMDTSKENISKIVSFMEQNGRNVELSSFIKYLIALGIQRYEIVRYLRSIKVNDIELAEAFDLIKEIKILE